MTSLRVYHRTRRPLRTGATIEYSDPYRLGSLGDLLEMLIDGWRIDHLHYADRCGLEGADEQPAAFLGLVRQEQREFIYLVDDGRGVSHRSVLAMFKEHPHVWKYRTPPTVEALSVPESPPTPATEWGQVLEPFPETMNVCPTALRAVVPINQTQSIDGVTAALTCLESYEDGARVHFLVHAPDNDATRDVLAVDGVVVDDKGRMYRMAVTDERLAGARLVGTFAVAPAIPAGVSTLTLTIGSLRLGTGGETIDGPWVFRFSLDAQ